MGLEFLKPARIDEILEVVTRVKDTTAATLTLDQRIGRDGVELFTAEVMVVLVSASGKPLQAVGGAAFRLAGRACRVQYGQAVLHRWTRDTAQYGCRLCALRSRRP